MSDDESGGSPSQADLRAEQDDKFEAWREAVGFEHGFPRMAALRAPAPLSNHFGQPAGANPDSRRFFLNQIHRDTVIEAYESLGSTSRVVLTAPGHGATTLARFVYQLAQDQTLIRRAIPVLVSIEDLVGGTYADLVTRAVEFLKDNHPHATERRFDPARPQSKVSDDPEREEKEYQRILQDHLDDLRDAADEVARSYFGKITAKQCELRIEGAIRAAVVRSLASLPWDRAIKPALYRDILGCERPDKASFEDRKQRLMAFLNADEISDEQYAEVATLAPILGDPDYPRLIRDLNGAGNIRISLILDLSATPVGRQFIGESVGEYFTAAYVKVLQNVAKAIKNIEQKASAGPQPVLPSLLDKTYILSRTAWGVFQADFAAQEDDVILMPHYRPVDVWAMLAQHYPPHQAESGRRSEVLAAVLDSAFIEINSTIALSTEMAILEHQLRAELEQETDVRYHRRSPRRGQADEMARLQASELAHLRANLDEVRTQMTELMKHIGIEPEA